MIPEMKNALWEQGASKTFSSTKSGVNCTTSGIESQFQQAMQSAGIILVNSYPMVNCTAFISKDISEAAKTVLIFSMLMDARLVGLWTTKPALTK
ncbi:MAG: hypothetical protein Q8L20_12500, partial [Gammaproteobacteria bacterium]|nr:hypothetical protein [Gammaproteobacteria bacterium]